MLELLKICFFVFSVVLYRPWGSLCIHHVYSLGLFPTLLNEMLAYPKNDLLHFHTSLDLLYEQFQTLSFDCNSIAANFQYAHHKVGSIRSEVVIYVYAFFSFI